MSLHDESVTLPMQPRRVAGQVVGVLLAAGRSSRFGADKLLAPMPDGTPVAVAAARNLKRALPDCVAVVRAGATALAARLLEEGLQVVECADAERGMGHSLACGVQASREASGWVIALGDMPCLRAETIGQVAEQLRCGADFAAPAFEGKRGHPVGVSARFGPQLVKLEGDAGARGLLLHNPGLLRTFQSADPGVLLDVDLRSDLPALADFLSGRRP